MTFLSCDMAIIDIIIDSISIIIIMFFSAVLCCFMLSTIYGELKLFIRLIDRSVPSCSWVKELHSVSYTEVRYM